MTREQITTIVMSLIQAGGVSFVAYWLVKGLKAQIWGLHDTIETQRKTLDAMEKWIAEPGKCESSIESCWATSGEVDKFKVIFTWLKDDTIAELEKANASKDEQLKEYATSKLKTLEAQEKLIAELP
jgi:hypothetical protein